MKIASVALLGYVLFSAQPLRAATPAVAGGANQASAVEGRVNQTLFNGEVRLRVTAARDATAQESDAVAPADDQRVIVVEATMSNGTHQQFNGVFDFSLAGADGSVVSSESRYVEPNPPPDAPPGGAWREKVTFIAPKAFVPRKLVVIQTVKTNETDVAKAFRIRLI